MSSPSELLVGCELDLVLRMHDAVARSSLMQASRFVPRVDECQVWVAIHLDDLASASHPESELESILRWAVDAEERSIALRFHPSGRELYLRTTDIHLLLSGRSSDAAVLSEVGRHFLIVWHSLRRRGDDHAVHSARIRHALRQDDASDRELDEEGEITEIATAMERLTEFVRLAVVFLQQKSGAQTDIDAALRKLEPSSSASRNWLKRVRRAVAFWLLGPRIEDARTSLLSAKTRLEGPSLSPSQTELVALVPGSVSPETKVVH